MAITARAAFIAAGLAIALTVRVGVGAAVEPAEQREAEAWVETTLARLSLEQKIAQLICAPIQGSYLAEDHPSRLEWMALARDHGIGAFVVYGGTPHDTAHLLNDLQQVAAVPILMASDFEGGPGQQFTGATEFPGNMALAAIGSDELAYEVGRVGALEGRAIGIHVTYSPVVDIQTRPENPVLSVRSFGRDLDLLGRLAGSYIRGYQEAGMLATAKHYPGRGDVDIIPATGFLINRKTAVQIEAEEFAAFRHAIGADVALVMSEHISVPALTNGSDLPASVNNTLATDWLRNRLGFTGILTTDDLWYPRVTERFGAEQAGVLALQAGHDMLLKPADPVKTVRAVADAVRSGAIAETQINASARKVLMAKTRVDLHRQRLVDTSRIDAVVGARAHRELVRTIAAQSLTVLVNDGILPMAPARLGRVAHVSIQRSAVDTMPATVDAALRAAFDVRASSPIRPDSSEAARNAALAAALAADTVIVSLFSQRTVYVDNGTLSDTNRQLVDQLVLARPQSTLVMSYGNPYLVEGIARPSAFVVGYGEGGFYGNQLAYVDAFIRLLKGEIAPRGRLPVHVSERFPFGSGVRY